MNKTSNETPVVSFNKKISIVENSSFSTSESVGNLKPNPSLNSLIYGTETPKVKLPHSSSFKVQRKKSVAVKDLNSIGLRKISSLQALNKKFDSIYNQPALSRRISKSCSRTLLNELNGSSFKDFKYLKSNNTNILIASETTNCVYLLVIILIVSAFSVLFIILIHFNFIKIFNY